VTGEGLVVQSGGGGGYKGLNIRGARVGGVEIPNSKRIETALQYIHGVGATTARQILLDIGMENKLARELSEEDLTNLRDEVSKYMVEGDLVWSSLTPMTSTLLQNFSVFLGFSFCCQNSSDKQ
jgi:hypothetical protein